MLKRPQYWVATRDKSEYDRRTIYMIYKRNLQLPFMGVFDAPDTQLSCARREQSTHAPQALEMLNGADCRTNWPQHSPRGSQGRRHRFGAHRLRLAAGHRARSNSQGESFGPSISLRKSLTIRSG
jgi:hypothetical protein